MSPISSLAELLATLFSQEELRQWILKEPSGKRLLSALPVGPVSTDEFAHQTALAFERNGFINRGFFERLEGARPRRAEEIRRVALAFGIHISVVVGTETGSGRGPETSLDGSDTTPSMTARSAKGHAPSASTGPRRLTDPPALNSAGSLPHWDQRSMIPTAWHVLQEATRRVPVAIYALGVAGFGAAASIVGAFFRYDWRVAFVATLSVFCLALPLYAFAWLIARGPREKAMRWLSLTVAWSAYVVVIGVAVLLASSVFFARPLDLRDWLTGATAYSEDQSHPTGDDVHTSRAGPGDGSHVPSPEGRHPGTPPTKTPRTADPQIPPLEDQASPIGAAGAPAGSDPQQALSTPTADPSPAAQQTAPDSREGSTLASHQQPSGTRTVLEKNPIKAGRNVNLSGDEIVVQESAIEAGVDANVEGSDIHMYGSPVSAGQDVNIGGEP